MSPGPDPAAGDPELQKTLDDLAFHDSWDLDDDGMIDGEEFGNVFGRLGVYDSWDHDASGALDVDELRLALPGGGPDLVAWDVDGDGRLDDLETRSGMIRLWDADGDGVLEPGELSRGSAAWRPEDPGGGGPDPT